MRSRWAILALLAVTACSETPTEQVVDKGATKTVVLITTKGTINAALYTELAPITTKNFIGLVQAGFYDGLTFHRFVADFVIQGGDPKGDGTGGSGTKIPLEVDPRLTHVMGALAMAHSADPNSGSSQFYITLGPAHQLDGDYAVFGEVTSGMDVVNALRAGDRMTRVFMQ